MRIAFALLVLIAMPAFAESNGPTKENAALEELYRARLQLCVLTGENQARVGYNCPATATKTEDCTKTGEVSADQALSMCVANKLTRDEQAGWKASLLNPVRAK